MISLSLPQDVEEQYIQYQGHNDSKNVFKAARTPSVLLSVSLVFYILSGVSAASLRQHTNQRRLAENS